ncbi:MAG: hypothetical protein ABEJ76_03745 [Halanaeroarchaeum sp.]
MTEEAELSRHQQKNVEDYLGRASQAMYGIAGIIFIAGLYYDLAHTGEMVIRAFAIADEPNANSGLFILAFIVGIVGFVLSRTEAFISSRRIEEVEKSQEWELDV